MMPEHHRPTHEARADEKAREHRLVDGTSLVDQGITARLNREGTAFADHRKDAIYHVAKHFLCQRERWESTLPRSQPNHADRPETVRSALNLPPARDLDPECDVSLWVPPSRSRLLAVARQSYFGAVLRGIQEIKLGPDSARQGQHSPAWVEQSDGAFAGVVQPGICVKAKPAGRGRYRLLTAYRTGVLPARGRGVVGPSAVNKVFHHAAQQWLQKRRLARRNLGGRR